MSRTIGVSLFALLIASLAQAGSIGDVFYIALENPTFTQPRSVRGPEQLLGNPAAPFLNSLVTPGNPKSVDVSYAKQPSERVADSGSVGTYTVSGVTGPPNDDDPYPNNIVDAPNVAQLVAAKAEAWRVDQEDVDLPNTTGQNFNSAGGTITNNVAAKNQYEVPLVSFSGTSSIYTNPYNGSHQYDYAAKHNPFVFFTATSGGGNPSPSNSQARNYAPLQRLATDLANTP